MYLKTYVDYHDLSSLLYLAVILRSIYSKVEYHIPLDLNERKILELVKENEYLIYSFERGTLK